jgi:replicative superfamily II helicase
MLLAWYRQTLAFIQEQKMIQDFEAMAMSEKEDQLLNETVAYLIKTEGIRKLLGDNYETTLIGKSAAIFYLDTADVQNLFYMYPSMTGRSHAIATQILGSMEMIQDAVGNIREKLIPGDIFTEQNALVNEFINSNGGRYNPKIKSSLCGNLLFWISKYVGDRFSKREEEIPIYPMLTGTLREIGRLTACCQFLAGNDKEMRARARNLEDTALRLIHGIPDEQLELSRISNVGLKRGEILYENGIKGPKEVVDNLIKVKALFGDKIGQKIIDGARKILNGK